jgi:hypothetical protein
MMSDHIDHPDLSSLARQAEQRAGFLAAVLAAYMTREQINDQALAARLGCSPDTLPRLRLCRVPRAAHFDDDIARIAAYTEITVEILARVLRSALR